VSIKVKIVKNKLPRIPSALNGQVLNMLNQTAHETVDLTQQLAPVDSGHLRASVKVQKEARPGSLKSIVEVGADYGIFVEYGTAHQEAEPFFTPALEGMRPIFKQRREAVLDAAAKIVAG
jgi:HK97 gp10 family phage protein